MALSGSGGMVDFDEANLLVKCTERIAYSYMDVRAYQNMRETESPTTPLPYWD